LENFRLGVDDATFEMGLISDPATKSKSVVLTDIGLQKAKRLFDERFAQSRYVRAPPRTGKFGVKVTPAAGTKGFICRCAVNGKPFFRVYENGGTFNDYQLAHDDLEVTIAADAMASFYSHENEKVLDHCPEVLGLEIRYEADI
jgi:hypothetical protein